MTQLRFKNLYLPVLSCTRNSQNRPLKKHQSFNHSKNQISDVLKMIQLKKAQLQRRNYQNQQSEISSDQDDQNTQQQTQPINNGINNIRYKILPMENSNKLNQQTYLSKMKKFIRQDNNQEESAVSLIKNRNFRVRTQQNQGSAKTTTNQTKMSQNRYSKIQPITPLIKYLKPVQMSKKISQLIPLIPQKTKQRNQITLKPILHFLQQNNPFFMKIDRVVSTCLLKVCNIVKKQKQQTIYQKQHPYQKIYIILSGKAKLSNKSIQLRKICVPGQTILQQVWISSNQNKKQPQSYQKARAIGTTYLLQIPLDKLKKVKQQMTKFGFKIHYNQLEALIKRNYIVKNALRIQKNKF